MATTQRPRAPRRPGPSGGPDPVSRGLIVVVVAVVIGVILLVRGGGIGFDSENASVQVESGGDSTTTTTAPTTTVPTTDKAPQTVKVVVANGSTVTGLAGRTAQYLAQLGYTNNVATDAESQVQASVVFFAPGFEGNAKAIARELRLPDSQVQALPPGAQLASNQPADSGVIVIAGPELAAVVGGTTGTATTVAGTAGTGATSTTLAGAGGATATTTTITATGGTGGTGTGGATTSLPRVTTTTR